MDPDKASSMLRLYQQALWSKPLPNGDFFDLSFEGGYLRYKDMNLPSDSITASPMYENVSNTIQEVTLYTMHSISLLLGNRAFETCAYFQGASCKV